MNQSAATLAMTPAVEFRIPFVFMLFSMDVFMPFADVIGAKFQRPKQVMATLRSEIVQTRYRFARDANPQRYDARATLDAVARDASVRDAQLLVWWTTHLLDSPLARALGCWEELLRQCDGDDRLWEGLELAPSARGELRKRFRESRDSKTYEQRLIEVDVPSLSDWDLHLYAVCLFEDHDPANQNPSLLASNAFTWWAAHRFWAQIVRAHSDEELTRFRDSAEQIARAIPRPDLIPLAHPRTLTIEEPP